MDSITANDAWANTQAKPSVSVLIPYYKFDCSRLLEALIKEAETLEEGVEILLADDGGNDQALNATLKTLQKHTTVPIHWQIYSANQGRSVIRNQLLNYARAERLVLLDCDMLPDSNNFIANYLAAFRSEPDTIAFIGGRSYKQIDPPTAEYQLYKYFSQRTECLPAPVRQQRAAWYVFTNNIAIKRASLIAEPFDDGYRGWGFEDTDWGIRIAKLGPLKHIDNTATHLGLMSDRLLLEKYRESPANFQRILSKHPDHMSQFAITRVAWKVSRIQSLAIIAWLNRLCAATVTSRWLPIKLRYWGLQLFRASLYAGDFASGSKPRPSSGDSAD